MRGKKAKYLRRRAKEFCLEAREHGYNVDPKKIYKQFKRAYKEG